MTSALGMGLFNGNWIEPLANWYAAGLSANASMVSGGEGRNQLYGGPSFLVTARTRSDQTDWRAPLLFTGGISGLGEEFF